jgi:hypothetical protein
MTSCARRHKLRQLMGCETGTKGWRVPLDVGAVIIRSDGKFAEHVPGDESEDDGSEDDAASAAYSVSKLCSNNNFQSPRKLPGI